jgi:hypothetical protein
VSRRINLEKLAEAIGCSSVRFRDRLGVEAQCQANVGVAEARLRCLHVHPLADEQSCGEAAEIVKPNAR